MQLQGEIEVFVRNADTLEIEGHHKKSNIVVDMTLVALVQGYGNNNCILPGSIAVSTNRMSPSRSNNSIPYSDGAGPGITSLGGSIPNVNSPVFFPSSGNTQQFTQWSTRVPVPPVNREINTIMLTDAGGYQTYLDNQWFGYGGFPYAHVYAYSKLSSPCSQTSTQILDVYYRIYFPVQNQLSNLTYQDVANKISGFQGGSPWLYDFAYTTPLKLPTIKPADIPNITLSPAFFYNQIGSNSQYAGNSTFMKRKFNQTFQLGDYQGLMIGGVSHQDNYHSNIMATSPYVTSKIQNVFGHAQNTTLQFLDVDALPTGTGHFVPSGNWNNQFAPTHPGGYYSGSFPKMYYVDIKTGGQVGTATYTFSKRPCFGYDVGLSSQSVTNYQNACSVPALSASTSRGGGGPNWQDTSLNPTLQTGLLGDLTKFSTRQLSSTLAYDSVSVVVANVNQVVLYNIANSAYWLYNGGFTNITQLAVVNGIIYASCTQTGLWSIDPNVGSVTSLASPAAGIDLSLTNGVAAGFNNSLWVVGNNCLAFFDGISTWTAYNETSTPAFNKPGISDGNYSNVEYLKVNTSNANHELLLIRKWNASIDSNIMGVWWSPVTSQNVTAGSLHLTNTYLQTGATPQLAFGSNDFTIEFWMNPDGNWSGANSAGSLFCTEGSNTPGTVFIGAQNGQVGMSIFDGSNRPSSDSTSTSTNIPNNAWTHIAGTRQGNTWTLWVNGQPQTSFTSTMSVSAATPWIGANPSYYPNAFIGQIAGLRVINGTAIYTAAFTPSTLPPTNIAGTVLLMNFLPSDGAQALDDSSSAIIWSQGNNNNLAGPYNTVITSANPYSSATLTSTATNIGGQQIINETLNAYGKVRLNRTHVGCSPTQGVWVMHYNNGVYSMTFGQNEVTVIPGITGNLYNLDNQDSQNCLEAMNSIMFVQGQTGEDCVLQFGGNYINIPTTNANQAVSQVYVLKVDGSGLDSSLTSSNSPSPSMLIDSTNWAAEMGVIGSNTALGFSNYGARDGGASINLGEGVIFTIAAVWAYSGFNGNPYSSTILSDIHVYPFDTGVGGSGGPTGYLGQTNYGWNGSQWVPGLTTPKTTHSSVDAFDEGLSIQFVDGTSGTSFVATEFYNFAVCEGTLKDNATTNTLEDNFYYKKVYINSTDLSAPTVPATPFQGTTGLVGIDVARSNSTDTMLDANNNTVFLDMNGNQFSVGNAVTVGDFYISYAFDPTNVNMKNVTFGIGNAGSMSQYSAYPQFQYYFVLNSDNNLYMCYLQNYTTGNISSQNLGAITGITSLAIRRQGGSIVFIVNGVPQSPNQAFQQPGPGYSRFNLLCTPNDVGAPSLQVANRTCPAATIVSNGTDYALQVGNSNLTTGYFNPLFGGIDTDARGAISCTINNVPAFMIHTDGTAPAQGEVSVNPFMGTFVFNAADAGATVTTSCTYFTHE